MLQERNLDLNKLDHAALVNNAATKMYRMGAIFFSCLGQPLSDTQATRTISQAAAQWALGILEF